MNFIPPTLTEKQIKYRNFLFNEIPFSKRKNLLVDDIAIYSVTSSYLANQMSKLIIKHLDNNLDVIILDGMACVGGNTLSFSKYFPTILSNELNQDRFNMLMHNANIMEKTNIRFFNMSILDLAVLPEIEYNVLFLDPEWGGPDYKLQTILRLTISNNSLEDFILRVFEQKESVNMIAIKLPLNYDNNYLKEQIQQNNLLKYSYYELNKMTLTIIQKTIIIP